MNTRSILRAAEVGLTAIGLTLGAAWLYAEVEARAFQWSQTRALDAMLAESQAADPPAAMAATAASESAKPARPRVATPAREKARPALARGVLGRIEIPRLGRTAMIAEGASDRRLRTAVGHIPSTALPGRRGNCGLAGHRDTYLKGLDRMRRHDLVHVRTPQGRFTYEVDWTGVVGPRRTDVLRPTSRPTLTLVTCYPFRAIGPAPARYIVRARLVEPVASAQSYSSEPSTQMND